MTRHLSDDEESFIEELGDVTLSAMGDGLEVDRIVECLEAQVDFVVFMDRCKDSVWVSEAFEEVYGE